MQIFEFAARDRKQVAERLVDLEMDALIGPRKLPVHGESVRRLSGVSTDGTKSA
jgi:hypothetical protein